MLRYTNIYGEREREREGAWEKEVEGYYTKDLAKCTLYLALETLLCSLSTFMTQYGMATWLKLDIHWSITQKAFLGRSGSSGHRCCCKREIQRFLVYCDNRSGFVYTYLLA